MEEKRIGCTLITPLFSFGAYKNISELRTSELKGAMRYLYRIASPDDTKTLAKTEAELFGGAAGSEPFDGHASPIRLLIRGNMESEKRDLLLHKSKEREVLSCFPDGHFEITAYLNRAVVREKSASGDNVDLDWYENLIKLSLILCGMGRRSRKGRGCIEIDDLIFENKQHMQKWICRILNEITFASLQRFKVVYEIQNEKIISTVRCSEKRPVIQKIITGRKIDKKQISRFLFAVDKACHDLKGGKLNLPVEITGYVKYKSKFASPLLIRIVKTKEGYYPLYVFIKGIYRYKTIDLNCSQREQFIHELEKIQGEDVRR